MSAANSPSAFRWNGLWRQGAGTTDDPNNGRLIWRLLGIKPCRWTYSREWRPDDLRPTRSYWLRTLVSELLRYPTETCDRCGRRFPEHLGSYWLADDALWIEVMGHDGGCLCPRCFTEAADRRGICVYWKPLVWLRKPDPAGNTGPGFSASSFPLSTGGVRGTALDAPTQDGE